MFCLKKTFKKGSYLVRKVCFSYESSSLEGVDEVFGSLGIQILHYIKDPCVSIMKKQKEIPFKNFNQLPSSPSLYFVKGIMNFIKIHIILNIDKEDLRKLFLEVNVQELYVAKFLRSPEFQGKHLKSLNHYLILISLNGQS